MFQVTPRAQKVFEAAGHPVASPETQHTEVLNDLMGKSLVCSTSPLEVFLFVFFSSIKNKKNSFTRCYQFVLFPLSCLCYSHLHCQMHCWGLCFRRLDAFLLFVIEQSFVICQGVFSTVFHGFLVFVFFTGMILNGKRKLSLL